MFNQLKESIVELNARERIKSILDENTFAELIQPFERFESPHLQKQGIVPQSDDGVTIAKGLLNNNKVTVISIEGEFQGGGIGEVSGAKIAGILERTLESCKNGELIIPIIMFDTGGVRLQEANYGLLSIAEIHSAIVELREHVPVIAVLPGKIGSFGGMGITVGLCSAIIMTKEARLGLNGPEVIEQEAGIREFDSSDRILTWKTIGGEQRVTSHLADYLIGDDVEELKSTLHAIIEKGFQSERVKSYDYYLDILNNLSVENRLSTDEIAHIYNGTEKLTKSRKHMQKESVTESRGKKWFKLLCGDENISEIPSLLVGDREVNGRKYRFIAVVPDENNLYPRVRNGEFGIREGWYIAKYLWEMINEDRGKDPRIVVPIVDVPGQAYGYNEELLGLHQACAAAVFAYANARINKHKVVTFIPGKAISGAFLSHGLQGNRLIAVNDKEVNVHVMSKKSAALITQRTLKELEEATKNIPAMAYDVESFSTLGALSHLLNNIKVDNPTEVDKDKILQIIEETAKEIDVSEYPEISIRINTEIAKEQGRIASILVREKIKDQWK